MSAEATAEMAPEQAQIEVASESNANSNDSLKPTGLHSPPDSNSAMKMDGSDDSELSDLEDPYPSIDVRPPTTAAPASIGESAADPDAIREDDVKEEEEKEEEDIGEVLPDHWSGTVPVFKPDMRQFKDFKKFMKKIDSYGMKSGIVKVIPPPDWKEQLPRLDDLVKQIRVREPIKQDIMGSNGTYRQVNILHQRSYNLPQWRQLCDQSEHQPPARRGERRANAEKPKVATRTRAAASSSTTVSKGRGSRTTRSRAKKVSAKDSAADQDRPMTPVSPKPTEDIIESVEKDLGADVDEDEDPVPVIGRMGASRQPKAKTQSTSARRKYARREASARIDEEAFRDWDYNMNISDYTAERCEELERIYWKTLTYAPPLYGADLPGTLFDEDTEAWNLNKLPNLLDVLGTKVPGVNTAYLYLGMWKATFAWHLEDVDLYSINYLHFGAPKQWYSISQGDARRFEAAMKSIWPTDAKACDQFLRHKAFLISPNHLQQYFNIKVNKCVSYPGEFVVTYPYGYHSGYNLGYNCAEAVNFALDSWLPMGKIAKRCECAQAQDSVWVDVYEIERKLRGESTDYEETEDEEEDEEEEDESGMPASHSSVIKIKQPSRKRKRTADDKGNKKAKKIRLRVRIKTQVEPPCCLCPNNVLDADLLPTDDGRKAHRLCAFYGPETWIETVDGKEVVANVANISKARLDLKCLYCRSKRGACFQCSRKKCARSYHATCAAAAGVFVEEGEVPIFGEDGTEYKEQAFEFSCRFHRSKRDKKLDSNALDECKATREAAAALKKGEIAQLQYYRGEIFAGVVIENRPDEHTFLIEIIPNGDRVEVEWKWLLLPDPADCHLQKASPNAIPMPTSRKAKDEINATKRVTEELPRADEPFVDGFTWAEFHTADDPINQAQVNINFYKEHQVWHYLGRTSTEARAQYTDNPRKEVHNSKSNFLDTVPRPGPPVPRRSYTTNYPLPAPPYGMPAKLDKPYQYKPKNSAKPPSTRPPYIPQNYTAQHFAPNGLAGKPFPTSASTFVPQSGTRPIYVPQTTPKALPQPMLRTVPPVPQATPKPTPPHKNTPPQTAHLRNKSLPFGIDSRPRISSTYGIMQTSGLGATPSPQNGQVFQAQARERSSSAASATSFTMPMTSSAIRPPSSASNQGNGGQALVKLPIPKPPPPSILQKYAFFQVHHNRDSTKYRTPYAPWGGFTNGFEGNLGAHLMKTPDALLPQQAGVNSNTSIPPMPRYPSVHMPGPGHSPNPSPHNAMYNTPGSSTTSPMSPYSLGSQADHHGASHNTPTPAGPAVLQTASGPYDPTSVLTKLHPAIRAQYAAMLQRKQAQAQTQPQGQAQTQLQGQAQTHAQTPQSPYPMAQKHQTYRAPQGTPTHAQRHQQTVSEKQQPYHVLPPQPHHPLPVPQQSQGHSYASSPQAYGFGPSQPQCSSPEPRTPPLQNAQNSVSSAPTQHLYHGQASQVRPSPPKQTFVPPPRPWEQLQRTGQHGSMLPPAPVQPLGMTADGPSGSPPPTSPQGLQPNNSAAQLRSVSVRQLPPVDHVTPMSLSPVTGQTNEFPEVPAGSLDLVEEIIRNARRASGYDSIYY
ncbi:JmjC domain-containing protein [Xylariales sp. AK1849]|nr:JmjC domain-containing protein [Xylariales sp. AK1849]